MCQLDGSGTRWVWALLSNGARATPLMSMADIAGEKSPVKAAKLGGRMSALTPKHPNGGQRIVCGGPATPWQLTRGQAKLEGRMYEGSGVSIANSFTRRVALFAKHTGPKRYVGKWAIGATAKQKLVLGECFLRLSALDILTQAGIEFQIDAQQEGRIKAYTEEGFCNPTGTQCLKLNLLTRPGRLLGERKLSKVAELSWAYERAERGRLATLRTQRVDENFGSNGHSQSQVHRSLASTGAKGVLCARTKGSVYCFLVNCTYQRVSHAQRDEGFSKFRSRNISSVYGSTSNEICMRHWGARHWAQTRRCGNMSKSVQQKPKERGENDVGNAAGCQSRLYLGRRFIHSSARTIVIIPGSPRRGVVYELLTASCAAFWEVPGASIAAGAFTQPTAHSISLERSIK
ncbi:hypothetical protein EDB89DRAFT_1905856 [Lactarius sanguifluus]|nr:hypothetical protein EDB89DRAFT_1905856 [Lactarius sanguifluus]